MTVPMDLLASRPAIRELLLRPRLGLLFDLDGTLTPIVEDPASTVVTPSMRAVLGRLASSATVAILTGRDVASARRIVAMDGLAYAGNHGAEWWENGRAELLPEVGPYVARMHRLAGLAADALGKVPGIYIEDKGPSVSIHYRGTPSPDESRRSILALLTGPDMSPDTGNELAIHEGKMVVEVRPPLRIDKGTALTRLVDSRGLRSVIMFGDDLTDVDAFDALRTLRDTGSVAGASVAVTGADTPPAVLAAADYRVEGVGALEAFLYWAADTVEGGG
jgi:trehalose 6-phosphate phosphatase